MKTAYTTHGLLFESKDVSIIVGDEPSPFKLEVNEVVSLIECSKIYVEGNFNSHDFIEVDLSSLTHDIEPEDLGGYSHIEISVVMGGFNFPILEIKDRSFKLENLSMELQERIHKVANEMYIDWLKVKAD